MKKEHNFPEYTEMVRNLFKIDIPGNRADLMHAAIGISGECGEIATASDRKNLIEELGDIEFYIEALHQRLAHYGYEITPILNLGVVLNPTNVFVVMGIAAAEILDACKKCWIYNDREPKIEAIQYGVRTMFLCLKYTYDIFGLEREEILYQNQIKLIGKDGRYKSGTYSDAAALAREDKIVPLEGTKISPEGIVTPKLSVLGDGGLAPVVTPGLAELDGLARTFLDSREETVQVHSSAPVSQDPGANFKTREFSEHTPRFADILGDKNLEGQKHIRRVAEELKASDVGNVEDILGSTKREE